jgi:hypothetical protein
LLCRAKKPSYNIFAHSSGRLRKSIREKTVAVRGLCACWQEDKQVTAPPVPAFSVRAAQVRVKDEKRFFTY